jgi:sec-independent protein translocase protein TatC
MTDVAMSFRDHIAELRSRLIKVMVALTVSTVVAFFFHEWILDVLADPYEAAVEGEPLAFFRPTEAFSLVMRLSLFGGVLLASPVIIYQTWRFVAPALTPREKRYVLPLSGIMGALFIAGVGLGYWSLSRGLEFLISFGGDALEPTVGANFYLTFAMRFILVFGLAFLFPVFLFAAAALNITTSKKLKGGRRWALTIILVTAAVVTPSGDPVTLLLLTTPLYLLYEITILAIRFVLKK